MQPTFLPWLGYFELIMKSDKFIFLDDFQFIYRSFHRRNRILQNGKELPITVPVNRKLNDKKSINQVVIHEDIPWRIKTWRILENSYGKTKFFHQYSRDIYPLIMNKTEILSNQNIKFIKKLCEILNINTEFILSSKMNATGQRSQKNQKLLEEASADIYLCANGSFEYMLEDGVFPLSHIDVLFQQAQTKAYFQRGNIMEFVPYLSVLDALFNIGAEETYNLISNMTEHWLSWDEMLERRKYEKVDEKL